MIFFSFSKRVSGFCYPRFLRCSLLMVCTFDLLLSFANIDEDVWLFNTDIVFVCSMFLTVAIIIYSSLLQPYANHFILTDTKHGFKFNHIFSFKFVVCIQRCIFSKFFNLFLIQLISIYRDQTFLVILTSSCVLAYIFVRDILALNVRVRI